ncbi:hypothetical protein LR48_Vigan05g104000 [Vigna angularis]|uniref:Uncharacterized protein n=1 Tax=Phaseolus angularis TaxID=3914 RepID=A0A0L9UL66_PHAAN|nr:hypothetical protein LR48_Vigan05g104000 [Vigna angularis]
MCKQSRDISHTRKNIKWLKFSHRAFVSQSIQLSNIMIIFQAKKSKESNISEYQ